ncbi:MAG: Atxe2 family lasso peptide isopeptidase [Steroidobacteraceae bacterium]
MAALATLGMGRAQSARGGEASVQPISTRDLLALRDIGGEEGTLAVSPDGRSVAFQLQWADFVAETYRSDWYVAPIVRDATPVRVGGGGDLMLAPAPFGRIDGARADLKAKWSPDGKWIAYLRRDGDRVQVWRSRADGTRQEQVTRSGANVLDFAWRPDGRAIYFEVGRNRESMARQGRAEARSGYLLDDRFLPVDSTKPHWFACRTLWHVPLPRSERCVPRLYVKVFGSTERVASAAEIGDFRRLLAPERPGGVGPGRAILGVAWNPRHDRAAWLENLEPRTEPGFAAPLTLFVDGHRCPATECTGRLEAVWWHSQEVVFLEEEGWADSVPALYVWTPGAGTPRRVYAKDSTLRSCAMADDRLVCLEETPTTPRKIVSVRLRDGHVDTIYDPNPGFRRYRLGRVEKIEVTDGFGNEAFGHLVYPPDFHSGCRYPLVIVQYRSRGFLRGGVGDEYPIFPLAAAGFLVYSSDNPEDQRLESRYDTSRLPGLVAFGSRDIGASGYRMRSALGAFNAVIDRLERRGIVDSARIGITGVSGGAEALYYALIHSTRFAAAATPGTWSPDAYGLIVNDTVRTIMEGTWDAHSRQEAVRTASAVISLAHNVDRVNTPLLIQVSDRELLSVLPDFVALRDAGKPVEAYVFPDEYHIKYHPWHKLAAGERAIDWFRFWLEGAEDPAPAKRQQYARWRRLRAHAERPSTAAVSGACGMSVAPGSRPDLGRDAGDERR